MRPISWSDGEDSFLVEKINEGWTYLEIAKVLSSKREDGKILTRNAIAGRKHRLSKRGSKMKAPTRTFVAKTHKAPKISKPPVKRKERVVKKKLPTPSVDQEVIRVRSSVGRLKPERPDFLPMTENPKTITELGHRQCRAAVGEPPRMYDGIANPFVFCGAPTREGETYCDDHASIMYAKPKPKTPGDGGFILSRLGTNKGAA